jgi:hypothetical protein
VEAEFYRKGKVYNRHLSTSTASGLEGRLLVVPGDGTRMPDVELIGMNDSNPYQQKDIKLP